MEPNRSWWQQIKIHPVRTVLVALLTVVIVLIILSILGYIFNWGWTGLGPYISPPHPKDSDFQRGKTLWDWLQLLIIPAVLAVAGYIINLTISRGEQEATKQRAQSEHEIAEDNQRETALKEYIDKMSELILHEELLGSDPKREVRRIAQIQTLTVLNRLDGKRKGIVLQLLNNSQLINNDKTIIGLSDADLSGAILSKAFLYGVSLQQVNLSEANLSGASLGYVALHLYPEEELEDLEPANLSRANLSEANLSKADLNQVDLSYAILIGANLNEANLEGTILNHANLSRANLSRTRLFHADLMYANLSEANLYQADLRNVDLSFANLKGVTGINEEELKDWNITKQTTMPNGDIHD